MCRRFRPVLAELRPAPARENLAIWPYTGLYRLLETGTGRAPAGTTNSFPVMPGFPLARGSVWAGGRDHAPSQVPQVGYQQLSRGSCTYLLPSSPELRGWLRRVRGAGCARARHVAVARDGGDAARHGPGGPRRCEWVGPGGLTREGETPLPSTSPHDHMILRWTHGSGNAPGFKQPIRSRRWGAKTGPRKG